MNNNPTQDRAVEPVEIERGLSKRETIAVMVMNGILSNMDYTQTVKAKEVTEATVKLTDALIDELNKSKQ